MSYIKIWVEYMCFGCTEEESLTLLFSSFSSLPAIPGYSLAVHASPQSLPAQNLSTLSVSQMQFFSEYF